MRSETIEKRIQGIKQELLQAGDMRPGSLSKQFNVCGVAGCHCKNPKSPKRHGPYYQLSYVHRGKSTTRFIRAKEMAIVRGQVANYKRFRKLIDDWVRLALESAEIKLTQSRLAAPK